MATVRRFVVQMHQMGLAHKSASGLYATLKKTAGGGKVVDVIVTKVTISGF